MSRSVQILLEDILESIGLIQGYVTGASKEEFERNPMMQDAVFRRLEVIGQAVKGLPLDLRDQHPEVPWKEITGTRDILAHEYFRVDTDLVWDMILHNLPELREEVQTVLDSTGRE